MEKKQKNDPSDQVKRQIKDNLNKNSHPSVKSKDNKKGSREIQKIDTSQGTLKIIPLGGLGEIGKNMTAYEFTAPNGQVDIIVVDCGFGFPTDEHLGVDYIIPDTQYLEGKKDKVRGIFITHAHEDHIGGLPYFLPKVTAPVFAPRLSAAIIERKLEEFKIAIGAGIRVVNPEKDVITVGPFTVEMFRVNHSIPDSVGFAIKTPIGRILQTGDFKIDLTPSDGKTTDFDKLIRYSGEGVLALLSDSTGAEVPGYTISEQEIAKAMTGIFEDATGRIIVGSFASLINRIQQVIDIAKKSGKKVAIVGRSMVDYTDIAIKHGYITVPANTIIDVKNINQYPDNQVVVMCTGSQGQTNSALVRMAEGAHKQIKIKKNDLVILSSSIIPGNEKSIYSMVDDLIRQGAKVIREGSKGPLSGSLHVSGHGGQAEMKLMMSLVKPKFFMPVHGERHMLAAHKELALSMGVPDEKIFVVDNGEIVEFGKDSARLGDKVPSGEVLVDGLGVGDVQGIVLRDRQAMGTDGIFVAIVTVDKKTGKLLSSPDIISRGFIYMRESEKLVQDARMEVRKLIEKSSMGGKTPDWNKVKTNLRDMLGKFLYKETNRRPMIVPVTIEVNRK